MYIFTSEFSFRLHRDFLETVGLIQVVLERLSYLSCALDVSWDLIDIIPGYAA